ncbi:hypothetical protein OG394_03805 [Kribbella sp. NBC_01245]|uniref:hypothetical protein n=1 Tax=Kribbella sp. NBC_01245 TaxID=2903578 RepID=UPI002E2B71AB|nr:hypothetical protein [Kribbella sp. NBC_01245]
MASESNGLSRRGLLIAGAAGLAGAGGLILPGRAAATEPGQPAVSSEPAGLPEPGAMVPMGMITRNYLGSAGCHLAYEPTGNTTNFTFESGFYSQLAAWKEYINNNTPDSWGWAETIYSYGAYTDKPGMHGQGRAFDIGRIKYLNSDGRTQWISMRYDVWRNYANADWWKRRYWGTAAGLMRRFRHVITYMDNGEHWNHIHVDNAIYGELDDCYYSTGSSSQTYIVQAACRQVWGLSTGIDGQWGSQTESHSTSVLRRIGRSSGTITNSANFEAFCTASFRKAVGTQAY